MNDEQTTPDNTTGDTAENNSNTGDAASDNYYSVDDPKKTISTTIGDGEMHNEGLVGDGTLTDDSTFSEGLTSEQEEAENHDSEG